MATATKLRRVFSERWTELRKRDRSAQLWMFEVTQIDVTFWQNLIPYLAKILLVEMKGYHRTGVLLLQKEFFYQILQKNYWGLIGGNTVRVCVIFLFWFPKHRFLMFPKQHFWYLCSVCGDHWINSTWYHSRGNSTGALGSGLPGRLRIVT